MKQFEATVIEEAGHASALVGMALSYNMKSDDEAHRVDGKKLSRAQKLAPKDGGHNKFLESMMIWVSVNAPRYWWQQADTYRISSKQSESTMHTILHRHLEQGDFIKPIPDFMLGYLNDLIDAKELDQVKQLLPEGFFQRRVWCMSYKTFRNIFMQRKAHKIKEWQVFIGQVLQQISHPEYIGTSDERVKICQAAGLLP